MKRKLLVAGVVSLLTVLAIAGGVALAAGKLGGDTPGDVAVTLQSAPQSAGEITQQRERFLEKVAAKLGLGAAQVKAAYTQAAKDVEFELRKKALDEYVASGRLTREQADALGVWLNSRPSSIDSLPSRLVPGLSLFGGPLRLISGGESEEVISKMAAALGTDAARISQAFIDAKKELSAELRKQSAVDALDKLVEAGALTAAEAEELKAWIELAPQFLLEDEVQPFGFLPGAPGQHPFKLTPGGKPRPNMVPGPFPFGRGQRPERRFEFQFGPDGFNLEAWPEGLEGLDGPMFDYLRDFMREHGVPFQVPAPSSPESVATPQAKDA